MDDDVILTDEAGRPIPKPMRADFESLADFVRAYHKFRTKVADVANRAFDDQFRRAIRK